MSQSNLNQKNILILMSGSIAGYKVCSLISQLVQKNFNVKVAMSASAQKFVGFATLEGLTGHPVHTDNFEPGQAMEHIYLARWADLILVAPATANTINKMSQGVGDDLLTTIFLAHDFKKPFLLAPAMNTKMYLHPTTQKSITELKNMGVEILEAASGVLACGEVGYGRLLEPHLIYDEVITRLKEYSPGMDLTPAPSPQKLMKVLITSGGTQEPIDDVRVITNKSTGKTASIIADQFSNAGFDVTYLCAETAVRPVLNATIFTFVTYKDLDQKLNSLLPNGYDFIIHTAAVSDYSVAQPASGKIDSSKDTIEIKLIKNPKLINKIKKLSPKSQLVGFKLTSQATSSTIEAKINDLFENAQCDYVVQNDWIQVHSSQHVFNLYSKKDIQKNLSITDLSFALITLSLNKESL
ncbi:MAG: bifunctional phosphopantothenoylcysteine decarboxylase/phosphopantothenate--cysteine ligase CoaBC [Moraxellaceae bacterium]|nr:bifunctional phosphopantothenoylcysteine decarboxylase/phosphopantothenate--cysteine ligase CoaBC [Pseudobdellovibrionaceae bacterium]